MIKIFALFALIIITLTTFIGFVSADAAPGDPPLGHGWNLVHGPGKVESPAQYFKDNECVTAIYGWVGQTQGWIHAFPDAPSYVNDDMKLLYPTEGYWIYCR